MKPIIVMSDWDNNDGQGAEVKLFWDMQNAINHGKALVEKYLKDRNITRRSFTGKWDQVYEEIWEEGYTFKSMLEDDVFDVFVHEGEFMDHPPICKGVF
ncbi:hypothetical protein [Bacillus gaemokensis]|uniref:Uncharacterized protein n=1 Tax=Bacillus gaemokensis TaxID=574375 RepID=A0A073K4B5_9BACI|nr:hypothetical protein [Bacillus gaemokensis]KEK22139.1 hypothetical protein BAGA_20900 [Bacillus gaemokensis]KYG35576.1 hypothetical protein AZF08_26230 [Bacillus gaemokensis]